MKHLKFISGFLLLAVQGYLMADQYVPDVNNAVGIKPADSSVHYGPTTIQNQSLHELSVFGPAKIFDTTVNNTTTVKGALDAKNSILNTVRVDGIADLENVKISGQIFINGPLYTRNSQIEEVSIASQELILSGTKVNKLIIRKNTRREIPQDVFLENGSQVNSIVFESKNGKVFFDDAGVSVNHIEGGEIVKNNN